MRLNTVRIKLVKEATISYKVSRSASQPEQAKNIIREYIGDEDREHFVCLLLSSQLKILAIHTVSIGDSQKALAYPREVFKAAILANATSIIIGHNHPSGCLDVSVQDKELTKHLVSAGKILEIPVLDHVVVTQDKALSFREEVQLNHLITS